MSKKTKDNRNLFEGNYYNWPSIDYNNLRNKAEQQQEEQEYQRKIDLEKAMQSVRDMGILPLDSTTGVWNQLDRNNLRSYPSIKPIKETDGNLTQLLIKAADLMATGVIETKHWMQLKNLICSEEESNIVMAEKIINAKIQIKDL